MLISPDGRVIGEWFGLYISSVFQPIVEGRDGTVLGHEAFLRSGLDDEGLSPWTLFSTATDDPTGAAALEADRAGLDSVVVGVLEDQRGVLAHVEPVAVRLGLTKDGLDLDQVVGGALPTRGHQVNAHPLKVAAGWLIALAWQPRRHTGCGQHDHHVGT